MDNQTNNNIGQPGAPLSPYDTVPQPVPVQNPVPMEQPVPVPMQPPMQQPAYGVMNQQMPANQSGVPFAPQPVEVFNPEFMAANNPPKKKSKAKIIIPVVIAVVLLVVAGVVAILFLGNSGGSKSEDTLDFYSESLVSVCKDGKWGFMDKSGTLAVDYQFDDVGIFTEDGLAVVNSNGKIGYIDKTGKFIVNPLYESGKPFYEGLACVQQDGLYGYIDTTGKVVISFQYEDAYNFDGGYAVVAIGESWGIIDKTGKYIVNPQYDVGAAGLNPWLLSVLLEGADYKTVLIPVSKNDKYGYIDINGNTVIELQFDYASTFYDCGYAYVRNGEKYGIIDKEGKYVINAKYDDVTICDGSIFIFQTNEKYGFVSVDGTETVTAQFETAGWIKDAGVFIVQIGEKYGIVDKEGNYIVNPNYQYLGGYGNGFFVAKKDGKYGYIDKTGAVVIDFKFDDATEFMDCSLAKVTENEKCGYINAKGEYVIEASYHDGSLMYDDGFAWVVSDDKKMNIITDKGIVIASELDGVKGNEANICDENGCYNKAGDDEEFCEDHCFDFADIIEDAGCSSYSSYLEVSDGGLTLKVSTYYYSSLGEFDDGASAALLIADYFGCDNLEETISGDTLYAYRGNYKIAMSCKPSYGYGSGYYYFYFKATKSLTV